MNNEYAVVKKELERLIARDWGDRCETKDTDDFDDLITVGDPDAGRCPCCLTYEKFDNFWRYIESHTDNL